MGRQTQRIAKNTGRRSFAWDWQTPVVLAAGVLIGGLIAHAIAVPNAPPTPAAQSVPVLVRAPVAGLTHPILSCKNAAPLTPGLTTLERQITAVLDQARARGLTRAGAYVADLEACQSFSIGVDQRFHPASMLKLPIAMAWLRRVGTDPSALQQPLTYEVSAPIDPREDAAAPEALHPGQAYTIEVLLKHMLVDSRNDAKWLLGKHLPPEQFDAVWRDLGLTPPDMTRDVTLSAKEIGTLFEALYDGTTMAPQAAELALKWLSVASWKDGLVAQLPADAVVAHKYGRRELQAAGLPSDIAQRDTAGKRVEVAARPGEPAIQLSDCGILYRPGRPILVCLMTEGRDEAVVTEALQTVGKLVWNSQAD